MLAVLASPSMARPPAVLALYLSLTLCLRWTGGVSAQNSCVTGSSCEECVSNTTCVWCGRTQKCVDYPVETFFPSHSLCPLSNARWSYCWLNYQTLIIAGAVFGCLFIISVLICCICCFKNFSKTRKAEMRLRHDEIRRKYGLTKKSPYSRI
ncbi:PTTG1 interacting protein b isoform 2-T2 [Clarias gariepinus]|uniref:PTTG1 interacting protein b isoform X2 n=1 Tax=Clarias gariepinus TaxID=13013 RepID=UPI00234DD103|nr:PTTG1 interacting protein b isoform X2 [Clarias gariepinus]